MRKLHIENGSVEVRGRRAVVRIRGRYVGTLLKADRGRWLVPGTPAAYAGPADAAEALADATAYGRAA
jgi:hypothetical protein